MVGIDVSITDSAITLDQHHYVRQVAKSFGQLSAAPTTSPASHHGCLGPVPPTQSEPLDTSRYPYLSLVGCLLWVTITRPDVTVVVSRACQHSRAPTMAHWLAVIHILRYLLATSSLYLVYRRAVRPIVVLTYADAAFGNESGKRSRCGHAVYLSECLVCWLTKPTTAV